LPAQRLGIRTVLLDRGVGIRNDRVGPVITHLAEILNVVENVQESDSVTSVSP